jgi:hypothetical protein
MPFDKFDAPDTAISYWVETTALNGSLTLPRWNTHWVKDDSRLTDLARIGVLRVEGSYTYFAQVLPGNIERLSMIMKASPPKPPDKSCAIDHVAIDRFMT